MKWIWIIGLLVLAVFPGDVRAASSAASITGVAVSAGIPTVTWAVDASDEMVREIQIAQDAEFQQLVPLVTTFAQITDFTQRSWTAAYFDPQMPLKDGVYYIRLLWRSQCRDSGLSDHYAICSGGPGTWTNGTAFTVATKPTSITSVTVAIGFPTVAWSIGEPDQMVTQVQIGLDAQFQRIVALASYDSKIFSFVARSWTPSRTDPGIPLANGTYYVRLMWRDRCKDSGDSEHTGLCLGGDGTWTGATPFTVSGVPVPPQPPPPPPNSLSVSTRFLTNSIHLRATYQIQPADYCPEFAPYDVLSSDWDRWNSPRCEAYVFQHADLVIRVTRRGRTIYKDDGEGLGSVSSHPSSDGGKWDYYLSPLVFRNYCTTGRNVWHVTLIDPYGRRNVSVSRSFSLRCRR